MFAWSLPLSQLEDREGRASCERLSLFAMLSPYLVTGYVWGQGSCYMKTGIRLILTEFVLGKGTCSGTL